MKTPLNYFIMLAKHWAWLIILGILICGGGTYVVSKLMHPIYEADATLYVKVCTPSSSANDCLSASTAAVPTYAELITKPAVLAPVLAQHPGLTLKQLTSMVSVKPGSNTQLIDVAVDNSNPQLAAQLANEISQSFSDFASSQLQASIEVSPAVVPTDPIKPKTSTYTAIGALVGLALAIALIVIFEWIDDRLTRPEEVQELLDLETLTTLPKLSRRQRLQKVGEIPVLEEKYRILCANLEAAQLVKPFKLVMVTSPLVNEGKSTVAANLAVFLAMTGKQVLLVDANLRFPVLNQHFELDNRQGLTSAFLKMWEHLDVDLDGQETDIPTLRVLTTGIIPANSTELLQSAFMNKLFEHFKKAQFDYVIFDTSPLLTVADAQILASRVQAAILVVDASKTARRVLVRAKQVLSRSYMRTRIVGVVLNKCPWSDYYDRRLMKPIQQSRKTFAMNMPSNNYRDVEQTSDRDNALSLPHMREVPEMDGTERS